MYATPEDIRARYKEVYLILAGKDAEGRPDTAAVEQALAEAASEIDAILGTRFAVPVSPVPPVLRRIAVDLAVGALPRTGATEASMYERRARDARDLLDKLAAGEAWSFVFRMRKCGPWPGAFGSSLPGCASSPC